MKTLITLLGLLLISLPVFGQTEGVPTKPAQETTILSEKPGFQTFTMPTSGSNPFFHMSLFPDKRYFFNYFPEEHHDFGRFFSVSVAHPYVITNDPSELAHAYDRPKTKLNIKLNNMLRNPEWMKGYFMYLSPTFRFRERSQSPFHRDDGMKFGFRLTIIKPYSKN